MDFFACDRARHDFAVMRLIGLTAIPPTRGDRARAANGAAGTDARGSPARESRAQFVRRILLPRRRAHAAVIRLAAIVRSRHAIASVSPSGLFANPSVADELHERGITCDAALL